MAVDVRIAVIAGTGVYDPNIMTNVRDETVNTPYGDVQLSVGNYRGKPLAFMNDAQGGSFRPPHLVNYRANGIKKLGVKCNCHSSRGFLNPSIRPVTCFVGDQFLITKSPPATFFEGIASSVVHLDRPFPARTERFPWYRLGFCASRWKYMSAEGLRLKTPAEIKYSPPGAATWHDQRSEATLTRRCYIPRMVTNYAAGISPTRLTHQEVVDMMLQNGENIRKLIMQAVTWIDVDRACRCQRAPGLTGSE